MPGNRDNNEEKPMIFATMAIHIQFFQGQKGIYLILKEKVGFLCVLNKGVEHTRGHLKAQ
jgi:hypothetical protein